MASEAPLKPSQWQAGDLGFSRNKGIMARAIRFAERRDGEPSQWNHVFMLDRQKSDGEWMVIQAEIRGVTNYRTLDEVCPGGKYEIVAFPDEKADRDKFMEFVRGQVKDDYSWLTILSCALDMYLPDAIGLRRANTWICSGLVACALMFAGFPPTVHIPDLYTTTPAAVRILLSAK